MSQPPTDNRPSIPDDNRIVSVLFADVCGFTGLAEHLEPEVVSELLNGCYQGLATEVHRFGGFVDKYIGDCMMVLFGAPSGHGNDAERAVQASLALQDFMASYSEQSRALIGEPLRIRVGIATGKVFAGWIGHEGARSYTVIGDVVNIAQRLEGEAEPGTVLIAETTYRHVRGLFPCSARGQLAVRGREQPVNAFTVEGGRSRFAVRIGSRHLYGAEVAFMGRDEELARLKSIWRACCEQRRGYAVSVTGSEGQGKSRLVHELLKELSQDHVAPAVGIGACSHHGRAPLEAFEEIILGLVGCHRREAADVVVGEIGRVVDLAIADRERAREVTQELTWLLGLESEGSAGVRRESAFGAIGDLLEGLCRHQPILLVLEDLHWAAPQTRSLIRFLSLRLQERPVLIFCCARPVFHDREPEWGTDLVRHEHLELNPLDQESTQDLVEHLLRYLDPPAPEMVRLITDQSDGNPFYVEELIRDLIDRGTIDVLDTTLWRVADTVSNLEVPASVEGVLQARLDRLSARAREVLQQGAVVGRRFTRSALKALGSLEGTGLDDALSELEQKELVFRRIEDNQAGDESFIFKQNLVRDVAYENLLKRQRTSYHRALAQWMESRRRQETTRSDEALIGHHFELGGCPEQSIQAYLRGARYGEQLFALEESRRAYDCARRVLDGSPDLGWDLRLPGTDIYAALAVEMGEARVRLGTGEFPIAEAACERAEALMRKRASVFGSGRTLLIRGELAMKTHKNGPGDSVVSDLAICARDTALAAGDQSTELSARILLLEESISRGDLQQGLSELPAIDRLLRGTVVAPRQGARLSELRAQVLHRTGDYGAAEQVLREALEDWEEGLREPDRRRRLLTQLAQIMDHRGEQSDAASLREEAERL